VFCGGGRYITTQGFTVLTTLFKSMHVVEMVMFIEIVTSRLIVHTKFEYVLWLANVHQSFIIHQKHFFELLTNKIFAVLHEKFGGKMK
jgi:hypothetical protein